MTLRTSFQRQYLILIRIYALHIINFCGLWPYRYDGQTKKFKFVWYYGLIKFLVLIHMSLLFIVSNDKLFLESHAHFKNNALRFIANIYLGFCTINFIVLYFGQTLYYEEMKSIATKGFKLIENLRIELDLNDSQYLTYLIQYTFKSVGITSLILLALSRNLKEISPNTENVIILSGCVIPCLVLKIFPDGFYGFNLLAKFYFKEINKKLKEILHKSKPCSKEALDKLERIAFLHQNLIEVITSIHRICGFQLVCYLLFGTFTLLIDCFIEYMLLLDIFRNGVRDVNLSSSIGTYLLIFLLFVELMFMACICNNVVLEANKAALLLRIYEKEVDLQFQKSVRSFCVQYGVWATGADSFSERLLHQKFEIKGCGMFVINLNFMYSILSTIATYLVILIQFELAP